MLSEVPVPGPVTRPPEAYRYLLLSSSAELLSDLICVIMVVMVEIAATAPAIPSQTVAEDENALCNGKHGKIDPVGTDEIDPVKTA